MNTATDRMLKAAAFREWLESKPPGAVVGAMCIGASCPLATYLRETGAPEANVGVSVWWPDGAANGAESLPPWAYDFRQFVDGPDDGWDERSGQPVTRELALSILEGVPS